MIKKIKEYFSTKKKRKFLENYFPRIFTFGLQIDEAIDGTIIKKEFVIKDKFRILESRYTSYRPNYISYRVYVLKDSKQFLVYNPAAEAQCFIGPWLDELLTELKEFFPEQS